MPRGGGVVMTDERINPYEAPATGELPPADGEPVDMTGSRWRWRQLLLKSIIYLRAFAVFNAIMVARGVVVWVSSIWESLWIEGLEPWRVPASSLGLWSTVTLLYFGSAALFIYSCSVLWSYSRELRIVAAHPKHDPTRLAELHLRFWKASLISTLLSLGSSVVGYFYDRYIDDMTWPIE